MALISNELRERTDRWIKQLKRDVLHGRRVFSEMRVTRRSEEGVGGIFATQWDTTGLG